MLKVREKNFAKNFVKVYKTYYFYITILNKVARPYKRQYENPERLQNQSGFSLFRTLFHKNGKKTPCGCKFLFYRLQKWLKARKEVLLLSLIFFCFSFKIWKKFI